MHSHSATGRVRTRLLTPHRGNGRLFLPLLLTYMSSLDEDVLMFDDFDFDIEDGLDADLVDDLTAVAVYREEAAVGPKPEQSCEALQEDQSADAVGSSLDESGEDNDEGTSFLAYSQTIGGIKVYEGDVKVAVNRNGEVLSVREGFLVNGQTVNLKSAMKEAKAVAKAFEYAGRTIAPSLAPVRLREAQSESSTFANPLSPNLSDVTSELNVVRVGDSLAYVEDVSWDDDGYWEVEYRSADGAETEVKLDPMTGEPRG